MNGPAAAFCGSDDRLLSIGMDGTPQLSRLDARGAFTTLWRDSETTLYPVSSVSAHGRTGLTGSTDPARFTVIESAGEGVSERARWTTPGPLPRHVYLSPEGDRVWTGTKMLDAATGAELPAFSLPEAARLTTGEWISPRRLAAVFADAMRSRLSLVEAGSGRTICAVSHDSRILALAVAPGGKLLAEGGHDKLVRLRDPESLAVIREFRAHDGSITALAFHPAKPVLATASDDLTVRLWNTDTGTMIEEIRGQEVAPVCLSWSPGGTRLASTGIDHFVRVWEPRMCKAGPEK